MVRGRQHAALANVHHVGEGQPTQSQLLDIIQREVSHARARMWTVHAPSSSHNHGTCCSLLIRPSKSERHARGVTWSTRSSSSVEANVVNLRRTPPQLRSCCASQSTHQRLHQRVTMQKIARSRPSSTALVFESLEEGNNTSSVCHALACVYTCDKQIIRIAPGLCSEHGQHARTQASA